MPTSVYFMSNQSPEGRTFFNLEVVGESKYQKNIREVIFYKVMVEKEHLEYTDDGLTASLILEDENKFDPGNAVRIDIDNKTVGYLAKEDAQIYRQALAKLNLVDIVGTCQAKAFGRRDDEGRQMKFGIWLAIEPERGLTIGDPPKKKGCFAPTAAMLILVLTIILISGKL